MGGGVEPYDTNTHSQSINVLHFVFLSFFCNNIDNNYTLSGGKHSNNNVISSLLYHTGGEAVNKRSINRIQQSINSTR